MSKELKIGILALIASVMLYTGFNFLKGMDFLSSTNSYYVVYDQIEGLTISNPVQLNGLSVGRVSDIQIIQGAKNRLILTLDIREDLKLGRATRATLTDNGLLGGKMIDLDIGEVKTPLQEGDTLRAKTDQGLMAYVSEKADPLVAKADSIMYQVIQVMGALEDSKDDIKSSMENFSEISGSMRDILAKSQLDQTLRNMQALSASLVNLEKEFHPIVGKMDQFAGKLNEMELEQAVKSARASLDNLNEVLAKVNNGEGTLGALANDDSLYQNLNKVSEDVDKLFIDLRENPKRYVNFSVFGKKDKDKEKE